MPSASTLHRVIRRDRRTGRALMVGREPEVTGPRRPDPLSELGLNVVAGGHGTGGQVFLREQKHLAQAPVLVPGAQVVHTSAVRSVLRTVAHAAAVGAAGRVQPLSILIVPPRPSGRGTESCPPGPPHPGDPWPSSGRSGGSHRTRQPGGREARNPARQHPQESRQAERATTRGHRCSRHALATGKLRRHVGNQCPAHAGVPRAIAKSDDLVALQVGEGVTDAAKLRCGEGVLKSFITNGASVIRESAMPVFVLSCSVALVGDAAAEGVDPRDRRGRRFPLMALVRAATCAVAAGARSYAAIGHWLRRAPQDALARLGFPVRGALGVRPAASMDTVRRVIEHEHPDGLAALLRPAGEERVGGPTPSGWRRTARVPGDRAPGRGPRPICWPSSTRTTRSSPSCGSPTRPTRSPACARYSAHWTSKAPG